jgi:hypothetical protein
LIRGKRKRVRGEEGYLLGCFTLLGGGLIDELFMEDLE